MDTLGHLASLVRYYSVLMTDAAGSGHLTSSLSATDLMVALFFGGFLHYDIKNPDLKTNDRVIFSKGHATPLFYSLWFASGAISVDELLTYRKFGSRLEGHPSIEFPYTEVPTGSLGQGLSAGLGMALAAKMDKLNYKTYVLLGDSEMSEGSVWEAIQLAAHYKANNLIGIIDVNRLGQSGETMLSWDVKEYQKRISAFGWETIVVDGHDLNQISSAFAQAQSSTQKPVMIIAKTIKGKGIKELENLEGFHGKPLPHQRVGEALKSLGEIDKDLRGKIAQPDEYLEKKADNLASPSYVAQYKLGDLAATRKAYGQTLVALFPAYSSLVALDAEVSNSTFSDDFKKEYPNSFFEMFIAEQNMVGTALGLSRRGKIPFVSTFAAFFTRAFDQIRMAGYAKANIKFVGSHAGVSIGQDGASQMGIEDIAMFRSIQDSVVLYPSDALSAQKLIESSIKHEGLVYLRTTRMETEVIYEDGEEFEIGGSKVVKSSDKDEVTVVGAGVTLHEALKAFKELQIDGINIRVIDLYSIKPIDSATLGRAAEETKGIIIVEDHREEGGIAEAVRTSLPDLKIPIISLAVRKMPRSGKPKELLRYEEIDCEAIVKKVRELLV